jgi:hypothetical protein
MAEINRIRDLVFGWPPEPNPIALSAVEPGGEKATIDL